MVRGARLIRGSLRFFPHLALALVVVLGAIWMARSSAPQSYALVNLGALAVGLLLAVALRRLRPRLSLRAALLAAPALAALALIVGPAVEGVHRWIAAGGLSLHAAMLAGPAFVIAAARLGGWLSALAATAFAAAIASQPDLAVAVALAAALADVALTRRDRLSLLSFLAAFAAMVWTAHLPDPLAPAPFVEGVIERLFAERDWLSMACLAALALAVFAPWRRRGGGSVVTWHVGLIGASLVGPYPAPLIGYGAAPILGYALALGLLGRARRWTIRN